MLFQPEKGLCCAQNSIKLIHPIYGQKVGKKISNSYCVFTATMQRSYFISVMLFLAYVLSQKNELNFFNKKRFSNSFISFSFRLPQKFLSEIPCFSSRSIPLIVCEVSFHSSDFRSSVFMVIVKRSPGNVTAPQSLESGGDVFPL